MGIEFGSILRVEMNGVGITPYLRRWTYRIMDTDGIRRHVVWLLDWSGPGLPRTGRAAGDIVKSRRCFTRRGAKRLGKRWVREMEADRA